MRRPDIFQLWFLLPVIGFLFGCKPPPQAERPPPKVTVGKAEEREMKDYDEYNGWMQAAATVEVRARVRGHITQVHFTDGQIVKKGDLLFELDPRPFQSEIDRSKEQLKVYQAQFVAAEKEEARLKDLLTKGGVSKTQAEKAEADRGSYEAQIEAAKEEIKRRELDMTYSRVEAEIAGRIGRAQLTAGNLVNAGGSDPLLTTIVAVNPIHVYFSVDERSLQRYKQTRTVNKENQTSVTVRDLKIPFEFGLETDEGFPHSGVLDFADNRIDPTTGTIQVRGEVKNEDGKFVPGSRVRIRVAIRDPYKAMVLPDTAILTDQDRKYVLVVDAQNKNTVVRRDVVLGKLLEDGMRVILSKVEANDTVILEGLQRARINYPVEPVDSNGKPVTAS